MVEKTPEPVRLPTFHQSQGVAPPAGMQAGSTAADSNLTVALTTPLFQRRTTGLASSSKNPLPSR